MSCSVLWKQERSGAVAAPLPDPSATPREPGSFSTFGGPQLSLFPSWLSRPLCCSPLPQVLHLQYPVGYEWQLCTPVPQDLGLPSSILGSTAAWLPHSSGVESWMASWNNSLLSYVKSVGWGEWVCRTETPDPGSHRQPLVAIFHPSPTTHSPLSHCTLSGI